MSTFSEKIKHLRKNKNVTQKHLAVEIGLSERTYQHLEAGSTVPTVDTLIKLCNYFNVSSDYLLGLSDAPERR